MISSFGLCGPAGSLSPRAVAHRAGLAVLVVIPFEAEGDLFPACAEPAIGLLFFEVMFADRAGKHGDYLHAHGTPDVCRAV